MKSPKELLGVGGMFSVALSLGSPPPAVNRHRFSVEPGLSSLPIAGESGHPTVWHGIVWARRGNLSKRRRRDDHNEAASEEVAARHLTHCSSPQTETRGRSGAASLARSSHRERHRRPGRRTSPYLLLCLFLSAVYQAACSPSLRDGIRSVFLMGFAALYPSYGLAILRFGKKACVLFLFSFVNPVGEVSDQGDEAAKRGRGVAAPVREVE